MFFLLRTAFWLSIVLVMLPSGTQTPAPSIETGEAVSAAFATLSDMGGFCARQPEACDVGGKAALAFGQRAQAGAQFLYDYLTDKKAPAETGSIKQDSRKPDSIKQNKQAVSQDTLRAEDLKPQFRTPLQAPLPPRDPRQPA
jgi:hypothetical protein